MSGMGFASKPSTNCVHIGGWWLGTLCDYVVRHCDTCGATWVFVKHEGGAFAWERVEEGEHVAGVGEAVRPVQSEQADEPVLEQPQPKRRTRRAVQDLPPPVESHAPTEGEQEAV